MLFDPMVKRFVVALLKSVYGILRLSIGLTQTSAATMPSVALGQAPAGLQLDAATLSLASLGASSPALAASSFGVANAGGACPRINHYLHI